MHEVSGTLDSVLHKDFEKCHASLEEDNRLAAFFGCLMHTVSHPMVQFFGHSWAEP
jgi:hypothetical protein